MNRYEQWISGIADSIITTAHKLSESFIGVALAVIAIVSAVPEFMGLLTTSDDLGLALAVAFTGVGSAHTAVRTKSNIMWGVFAVHLVIVEIILFGHGGTTEMAYPIITVVGAAVMALSSEHRTTSEVEATAAIDDKAFEREEKRKDNELKRQIRLERERKKLSNSSVKSTASDSSVKPASTSGGKVENRRQKLVEILHSFDSPSDINKTKIAKELGVSRPTVISDIDALESSGQISLNGSVKVNTSGVSA
jgi:hypothetical protein